MDPRAVVSQAGFLFEKSLGIWFVIWALRYKWGWDYKLNTVAKNARWGVVCICYLLAAGLPGPGPVRAVSGLVGLVFLCWPNFAYYLTNLFVEWPEAEGSVVSVDQTGSRQSISYSYQHQGEVYGGTASLGRGETVAAGYAPGQAIAVRYDPLNPDKSKILLRATA
ncbi:MAG: DUF3592 domain-containing protein [Bryobacteraceae bacterium]